MIRLLVKVVLICSVSVSSTLAATEVSPSSGSASDRPIVSDSVRVVLSNVESVGLVIVVNGKGAKTVATARMEILSCGEEIAGNVDEELAKHLHVGRNFIIVTLYKEKSSGLTFCYDGTWSGDMKIVRNGSPFWQKEIYDKSSGNGIQYWKVFVADVSSTGILTLSVKPSNEELSVLRKAMNSLQDSLISGADVSTPFELRSDHSGVGK